jgi:hypothetical protein
LIMIVLGETILGQAIASDTTPTVQYGVHMFFGLAIAFMLHVRLQHFAVVPRHIPHSNHVLTCCLPGIVCLCPNSTAQILYFESQPFIASLHAMR